MIDESRVARKLNYMELVPKINFLLEGNCIIIVLCVLNTLM